MIYKLRKFIKYVPGWKTDRHILVIESDDWGSIRMPSRIAYHRLLNLGLNLNGGDGLRYCLYDTIERSSDLELLYEVLHSCKDSNNNPAVITANCIVANPDFDKIKESGFEKYYYEHVTETFKKYKGSENALNLWHEGILNNVFKPQFHGREHLNIYPWMNALKRNDCETHAAFNERMWSFIPTLYSDTNIQYEAAFQCSKYSSLSNLMEIMDDGIKIFENIVKYKPEYFVPPNGCINNALNSFCFTNGIKFRSTSKIQNESIGNANKRKKFHWLSQKDKSGISYIIRNCVFEPSKPGKDWIDSCLIDINSAFEMKTPAIISTHRVNYVGAHDIKNRDKGLKELSRLLRAVINKWPQIEFLASNELGHLFETTKNYSFFYKRLKAV